MNIESFGPKTVVAEVAFNIPEPGSRTRQRNAVVELLMGPTQQQQWPCVLDGHC